MARRGSLCRFFGGDISLRYGDEKNLGRVGLLGVFDRVGFGKRSNTSAAYWLRPKLTLLAACYNAAMKSKYIKNVLGLVVLITTIGAFVHFFQQHPQYLQQLLQTNHWFILLIISLYLVFIVVLMFIYDACMHLCGIKLPFKEKFLLTSYSSIVNFFGPLQSGPGVRAVYLKAKHGVRLRDYTLATLMYYCIYAFFSAFFLLVGTRPWWQTLIALAAVAGISITAIRFFVGRDKQPGKSRFRLTGPALTALIIFTFLQVLLFAVIYFIELRTVNSHTTWGQAVSYTGAANFALFVSLTPGAIGFRESFLVFSKHLHHVSTANIFSANLIDRTAYVAALGILFVLVLSMHAGKRFKVATNSK